MEATALSLAGNALGVLMPMLQEKLLRIVNVRDDAHFIKDELESMHAFLITNATTWHTVMPNGIQALKALRTLSVVSFKRSQRDLEEMTQLTKLGLKDITGENAMAFCATIDKLSDQLHSLKAIWSSDVPLEFLEKVSQPPVHLRSLLLSGRMCHLPTWFESLKRVSKLALAHTELREGEMQVIQYSLPSLNELILFENSYAELVWSIGEGAFPVLKFLEIDDRIPLKDLIMEEGSAPQLERIQIKQSTESEHISLQDKRRATRLNVNIDRGFSNLNDWRLYQYGYGS
ncbi:hypothetical protein J5N97_022200 [Dioscorea zingiberensis]|uniref:Disease resistance R13L4/SHOC-2-like LRR domain-containing protein n=1 Tax=Dioscorea zingiberensis TaxID=325984 RepID=A0A9D5CAQ3_9LILI|nr:hypothetical protein J5N97_022200 [Dioscorea zingiberensis]